jgi:hypothetical protein
VVDTAPLLVTVALLMPGPPDAKLDEPEPVETVPKVSEPVVAGVLPPRAKAGAVASAIAAIAANKTFLISKLNPSSFHSVVYRARLITGAVSVWQWWFQRPAGRLIDGATLGSCPPAP